MSRGIALSTAGVKLSYAVETVADTRPETGYVHIPDIRRSPTSTPSLRRTRQPTWRRPSTSSMWPV